MQGKNGHCTLRRPPLDLSVALDLGQYLFVERSDQMVLELRKSLQRKALRISSASSIVTKRVALTELAFFLPKKRRKVHAKVGSLTLAFFV